MSGISVILPVCRNADTLVELHARLVAALHTEDAPLELIFVNDACPAGSATPLAQLARDGRVRVLTHERNQGQRLAVWHGLEQARGDVIVTMDADLQDPPEAIPGMLCAMRDAHAGAVFAGRRGEYQGRLRMATSRLFKKAVHRMTGLPPDAGAFLAMTREARDRIFQLEVASPYLPALLCASGVKLISIPVERDPRKTGASAYSEWARFRMAWSGLRAAWKARRKRPIAEAPGPRENRSR
jgi:glycosyltransferase involved in cell wall biosynthesis